MLHPDLIVHVPAFIYCVISRVFATMTVPCHHALLVVMLLHLLSATALENVLLRMVVWLHWSSVRGHVWFPSGVLDVWNNFALL
jgi:hypothetical protein